MFPNFACLKLGGSLILLQKHRGKFRFALPLAPITDAHKEPTIASTSRVKVGFEPHMKMMTAALILSGGGFQVSSRGSQWLQALASKNRFFSPCKRVNRWDLSINKRAAGSGGVQESVRVWIAVPALVREQRKRGVHSDRDEEDEQANIVIFFPISVLSFLSG